MRLRLRLHGASDGLARRLAAPLGARFPGVLAGGDDGVVPLTVDVTGLDDAAALFEVCVQVAWVLGSDRPTDPLPAIGGHGVSRRGLFGLLGVGAADVPEPVPRLQLRGCQRASGCQRCIAACPAGALSLAQGQLGLEHELCTRCGVCVAACPVGVLEQPPATEAGVLAVLDQVRQQASSGVTVVFTCSPGPVRPWAVQIPVGSIGAVGARWLVDALAAGAQAVLVRCSDGVCPGREHAAGAVAAVSELVGDDMTVRYLEKKAMPVVATGVPRQPVPMSAKTDGWARFAAGVMGVGRPDAPAVGFVDAQVGEACTSCGVCVQVCPRGAWRLAGGEGAQAGTTLSFQAGACSGCGACVGCCPEHALALVVSRASVSEVAAAWRPVHADELVLCRLCGKPVGSRAMLARINAVLGPGARLDELCPSCKQERVL